MRRIIGTIMYFWGALVPIKHMYIPKTLSLLTFIALVAIIIYNIVRYLS